MDFPAGFGVGLGGASRDQDELFSEMFIALIMGIGVMYLVLVMQFGSFTAPVADHAVAAAVADRRGARAQR